MSTLKIELSTESIVNEKERCMDLSNVDLPELSKMEYVPLAVKQLYMGSKKLYLKETAILNLTHLFIDNMDLVEKCERPDSLQHLFIHKCSEFFWPDVPNIYVEKYDVKDFIRKYSPDQLHIFNYDFKDWGTCHYFESYSVSERKKIKAFGFNITYYTLTKNQKPFEQEPDKHFLVERTPVEREPIKQEPDEQEDPSPRLSRKELVELNWKNLPTCLTRLPDEIYKFFYKASLEGRLTGAKYITSTVPPGLKISDVQYYLQYEMKEFSVALSDDRVIVTVQKSLLR